MASLPYLIRSNFIKTTYDISLDSQISFLPLGFSPPRVRKSLRERVMERVENESNNDKRRESEGVSENDKGI